MKIYEVYSIDTKQSMRDEVLIFQTDNIELAKGYAKDYKNKLVNESKSVYRHDVEIRTEIDEFGNYNTIEF